MCWEAQRGRVFRGNDLSVHLVLNVDEDEVPVKILRRYIRKIIGNTIMELKEA